MVSDMKMQITAGIIAIILGIFVGWNIAQASSPEVKKTTPAGSKLVNTAFNSQVTNFRVEFNNLLHEHTVMAGETLTLLYEGKDTTRQMQLMDDNQNKLAAQVEKVYGPDVRDQFEDLWTKHMNEYENYTLAKKENDTEKMNVARGNLERISDQFGELFDNAGENLSASTVSSLMREHASGTLAVVDAAAADDVTQKANEMKAGFDQSGEFADTLSRGMVLDNPQAFNQ